MDTQLPTIDLSIIVPTFNERKNVPMLVRCLHDALAGLRWEVIFVDDDSPDGTANVIRAIAQQDPHVRCIQRIGRRGLSSACIEGMLASSAPYLAVMDADMQHDERLLPQMLTTLKNDEADIVVGSRYVAGGGIGDWSRSRLQISQFATRLSKFVVKAELSDPMSGFFMLKREAFNGAMRDLSAIGFKILVDLFASSPKPLRFKELPYEFRTRQAGESKLDSQAAWDYVMLLLDKSVGRYVPVRFLSFALVGGVGVVVHLVTVAALFRLIAVGFVSSQTIATVVEMVSNFSLNNLITYRDMRLRGWGWARGLLSFVVACSVGALANVGVASYLFAERADWIVAALSGVLVGAVWNYAVTAVYTWNKPKKAA